MPCQSRHLWFALAVAVAVAACAGSAAVATAPTSSPVTAVPTPTPTRPPASASPSVAAAPSGFPSAQELPAPLTTITGRILFSSEGNGISPGLGGVAQPLYIDATGLHAIPMPADPTFAHAVWGPDDSIFFENGAGIRHLDRMTIEGTGITTLMGHDSQGAPTISADGTKIAFENYIDQGALSTDLGLHVANADGSGALAVTPGNKVPSKGGDTWPALSPDGRWVAFERSPDLDGTVAGLFLVRSDGTGLRRLVPDSMGVGRPRWSPDGKHILFSGHDAASTVPRLYVVDVAGGAPRLLTSQHDQGHVLVGDWSPDGSQIAFSYWRPGSWNNELHVINADGSGETVLWVSPDYRSVEAPDWGP